MFGLNNSCRHLTKSVMLCLHPFMQLNLYIELAEKIISLIHRTCRRIHIAYISNLQKNSYCLYTELAEEFISLIHRTCRRIHIAYTSNLQKNSYRLYIELAEEFILPIMNTVWLKNILFFSGRENVLYVNIW